MNAAAGPEIWFYHLEQSSLGQVLPELLDRTLQRGWRAIVRVADPSELEDIDDALWTWREDSFLAHGRSDAPHADRQPILLTSSHENPNGAHALFIVDGSELGETETYARCFIIFEGRDETALHGARERWRTLKGQGANLAYWKQSDEGRWEKAA
ncbi:DNA polymerase III subunit chi [Brevundimonas sp.]|uniref:DNA polymerase III subunit chi n=1 Tax=Brevundimonas sp. TaxID=1871086 RepID=UPI003BABB069